MSSRRHWAAQRGAADLPRLLAAALFCAGLLALALSSAACDSPCDTGADEASTVDVTSVQPVGNLYASNPWAGPFFPFPPGKRYRFHHDLGTADLFVMVNVSFDEYPLPASNVSQATGDQALIEAVDTELIQVRNNTCADLWVRVSAISATPD